MATISESLDTIQTHLREKYLNDIDIVQRRVSADPDTWAPDHLEEAMVEIAKLNKLLLATDELVLVPSPQGEYMCIGPVGRLGPEGRLGPVGRPP
jgi:hypothetical protein